jgi:hypothetical protein
MASRERPTSLPTLQIVTPPKSEIRPFSFWSQGCLARDHRERISPRRGRKPETDWRERCTNSRELSSFSKRPTGDEVADGVYHLGGTRQGLCRGGLDHQRYPNAFFEKLCANLSLRLGLSQTPWSRPKRVTHRFQSRMREIRLSGSEGGSAAALPPSIKLSRNLLGIYFLTLRDDHCTTTMR